MNNRLATLFLRLLWIPISGFFLFHIAATFIRSINHLAYYLTEDSIDLWLDFKGVELVVLVTCALTISVYILLEIVGCFKADLSRSNTLKHLRYGPIAVSFLSVLIVTLFDIGMIEYSKYQIRSYVFSMGESIERPELDLHNDYRHWCGNGASARENDLYFTTAISGMDHENPYVRSRSLLMSSRVQDWLNGGDQRFRDNMLLACKDGNPVVQRTIAELLERSNSSCKAKPNSVK